MSDRTITIRPFGGSSGVILSKQLLEHMGANAGESVIAVPAPGGIIMLIPKDSRKGRVMSSALACMTKYDAALRRLAAR